MCGRVSGAAAALLAACIALSGCAAATAPTASILLTEDEATDKAIAYLRYTDYGEGRIDVLNHIKDKALLTTGHNDCGPILKPVWAFHLHAQYEGWLYLDARTGERQCSSLPFLR